MTATGWKVFTSDCRSPIQTDTPKVWDGALPFTLPAVTLDTGDDDCAAGWNYCESLSTAFRIGGLWSDGRPSRAVLVEPAEDAIKRGEKCRASSLSLVRAATPDEIADAITELSQAFAEHAERMASEQLAWYEALGRPLHDQEAVEAGLRTALGVRGLGSWTLKQYPDARDARDARDALTVTYAALRGWTTCAPDLLTIGIRDAYKHGLAVAVPVGKNVLGYAMDPEPPAA